MQTNPFPAILLAGSSNSGKSVLSFLLTAHLRKMHISHYLLRTMPADENNWYLESDDQSLVRTLRSEHKRGYSAKFIMQMLRVIEQRRVPLLVDIGGEPQDDQFGLIEACSHSVLLYDDEAICAKWQAMLAHAGLQPVAELLSRQVADDQILEQRPVLTGFISGLECDPAQRKMGTTFEALLSRVAGICNYEEAYLERLHLADAPYPPLVERELARNLGMPVAEKLFWHPEVLPMLTKLVGAGDIAALYGHGPVWLAAMLAAQTLPAPLSIFDVRFGWVTVPQVRHGPQGGLSVSYAPAAVDGALWACIKLSKEGMLEKGGFSIATPPNHDGLILSGKLPRWTFAALTRFFVKNHASHKNSHTQWIAIHDPDYHHAVVVFSRCKSMPLGTVLLLKHRK